MSRTKSARLLAILALALFTAGATVALVGCSAKHRLVPGAPDWVNKGSGAFEVEDGRFFYGVGAVSGITSQTLAMQSADQRARADIGRQIATFIDELYRDYQATTTGRLAPQPQVEQHVDNTLETLTKVTVRGASIIDHWRDPESNTLFSLAQLDLNRMKTTLGEEEQLDPLLRKFIADHVEQTFERLKKK